DFKTNTIHTMTTTRIIGLVCSNLVGFGGLWLIHKNYLDMNDFADLSLMFVTID
nr:putative membrane protein [Emiliania huxleyi virus 86]